MFFFFNDTATTEIYTLSLHDALPILDWQRGLRSRLVVEVSYPSYRGNTLVLPAANSRSEEHTSELQSLAYLVCRLLLEKKKKNSVPTLVLNRVTTLPLNRAHAQTTPR